MFFVLEIIRIIASLVGVILLLAGLALFVYGFYVVAAEGNYGIGGALIVGGILAIAISNVLGRFAKGDAE